MPLLPVLRLFDSLAARAGWLGRPLDPEALMARASGRGGDFGDIPFEEPLARLIDAYVADAAPSIVGCLALRWDVLRFLGNLRRLAAEEAADPAIAAEPIAAPIFITGLPRSGTSFLHRLLLEDPDNHAPRVWQTIAPYPPRGAQRDRRIAKVDRQLAAFARLAPEFPGLHPLRATSPQECSEILAHVFRSLRFDTTWRVPSYREWLDRAGHLPAYLFERRFLQHLQHQRRADGAGPGRWVLKCPDHVFALRALRAAFPDARIVFVHRDPVSVVLSVAKLTEVLRRPFSRKVDPIEIGRGESARWQLGARLMMEEAGRDRGDICHVHHAALTADPLGTARRVYRHFGLDLSPAAEAAIARLATRQPGGGYAHDAYRFEAYGLDPGRERAAFRDYLDYFDIDAELGPPRAVRARVAAAA
ncbi:MAG: sulfotransferase [Rhodospirillales bacterium]|nr:sulfotransferase [Rhodospirillales bacterium]